MKKMLLLALVALSLTVPVLHAQPSWRALPNAPRSWRLDDIYFLTPQKGWAINPYYNYLNPKQRGRILTTNDGGWTWTTLLDSSLTFFRAVGFADSLHGWVGNLGEYTPDTNFMYQTSDGGISWQPVTNFTGPKPAGICGISVVNDSVIYAYGRYSGPAIIMKTTNKGLTWNSQDLSNIASGLIDGHFVHPDTGFITGTHDTSRAGLILSTVDGGATWQPCYQGTRRREKIWKVTFPSRMIGYASIESDFHIYPDTTRFLKTTDGGRTWQEHIFRIGTYYNLEGIGFINDSTGWIGGDNNQAATYKTTDGGATWSVDGTFGIQTPPYDRYPGYAINRFRRFGDTLMYASGNTIYRYGAPPTIVIPVQPEQARVRVYPNPFSGYLEINLSSGGSKEQPVVSVYNLLGQALLTDQPLKEGVNRFLLPGAQKGLYFYRISAGSTQIASGSLLAQ